MVGHQTVGNYADAKTQPIAADSMKVVLAIDVIAEYFPTLVTSRDQMVDGTGSLQSRRSRHPRKSCRRADPAGANRLAPENAKLPA